MLESYANDADLTALGCNVKRAFLRGALVARLLSEAAWKACPEYAGAGIERPIFVTGLPRTGTTALHRLLTADPSHQGLEMWLTPAPRPRPPRQARGGQPGVPADSGELRAASHRPSRVHGRALHGGRSGRGMLAAAAAVDAVDLLRVPGPPAGLLRVAARAGLDRRIPQAPAQPAAHRPARRRPALGAQEP